MCQNLIERVQLKSSSSSLFELTFVAHETIVARGDKQREVKLENSFVAIIELVSKCELVNYRDQVICYCYGEKD